MSVDVENRIRRANLLPGDEQLEQLYAADLSDLLFEDIRAEKEGRMTETTNRQRPVTEELSPTASETAPAVSPEATLRSPRAQPALAGLLALALTGALIALITATGSMEPAASPMEVAEQFIGARNAGDAGTVVSLLADDASITEGITFIDSPEEYSALIDHERALGWTMDIESCSETPNVSGKIVCSYLIETDFSQALGLGPFDGSRLNLIVDDGRIQSVFNRVNYRSFEPEAMEPFAAWLEQQDPAMIDMLSLRRVAWPDEETNARLKQLVAEFVEHIEENGAP